MDADIATHEELDGVNIKVESDDLVIKQEHEEDDHKYGISEDIKYDFPDYVSISNTDDFADFQTIPSTNGVEKNVCKICKTYFGDSVSLEHHLENCCRQVCTLNAHELTHETPSMDKKVMIKQHKRPQYYKCKFCKNSYKFSAELRYHLITHANATVKHHLCLYCENKFSLSYPSKCEQTQTQHSRAHLKQNIDNNASESSQMLQRFNCAVCKKSYHKQTSLEKHKCLNTKKKPNKSSKCNKEVSNGIGEHTFTRTGRKRYECSHCGRCFPQKSNLTVHERIHTGEKPYECSHCKKRFAGSSARTRHERTHAGDKPYECTHCSKRFSLKSILTMHERLHTGERPYECSQCKKCFVDRGVLNRHERTHTGDKPYECSHCSKCFTQRNDRDRHERTHTGEKPFQCSHCSKRFARQFYLTGHERTHTGEKPYECSHCSKTFALKSGLTVHQRTHTKEKPYECSYCSERFSKQTALNRHNKQIHVDEKR